jgi:hypothetical protein
MRADARNLTGVWQGLYTYPNGESVSFVATLIDSGGALDPRALRARSLIERHPLRHARRHAQRQRGRVSQDL